MSDLETLTALQRRLRWEEACERNARPNRPPKSHKVGRPAAQGFCHSLSDWEVAEAYQMWDGTYPGAERLAPIYHVSYRTLLRAFKRMEEKWKELQHEHQSR